MRTVTYAIGDVHGRMDLLETLLDAIEADAGRRAARAKIVFTGDYVDRGPDSRGVVERLIAGPRRRQDEFVCLRGNHDDLFVQAAITNDVLPEWARPLHEHALLSYGVTEESQKAQCSAFLRHVAFLRRLPLTHDDGANLFVHAGIRPGIPLEDQAETDLLWIREPFLDHRGPLPRRIVHGHTIVGDTPVVTGNRVSIDTGAYRSGILTAAVFDGATTAFLATAGKADKPAMVREAMVVAMVRGRALTQKIRAAFDDYLAGAIEASEMMKIVEGP